MTSLLKKSKLIKSVFSAAFVVVIVISMAISSFAVETWKTVDTFSLGNLPNYVKTSGIVLRVLSDKSTNIYNGGSSVSLYIPYRLTASWVSGNAYRLQFFIGTITSVESTIFDIYLCNSYEEAASGNLLFSSASSTVEQLQNGIDVNFTYKGEQYLVFIFTISSGALINFSEVYINAYNPNAVQESQNQEIIDGQKEQNSKLDEQNSKLFDDGETYPMPSIDLTEQYSLFDENKNDLLENGGLITQSNRIVNGVKAFATMFTAVYSSFTEDETLQFIPMLMYLSVIVSLILLIFGFLKSRSDK